MEKQTYNTYNRKIIEKNNIDIINAHGYYLHFNRTYGFNFVGSYIDTPFSTGIKNRFSFGRYHHILLRFFNVLE